MKRSLCNNGEYDGCLVLVQADMDERWLIYVAPAPGSGINFYDDFHVGNDSDMARLVTEWRVDWLSEEEDARIEPEVFDIRRHWPK